MVCSAFRNEGDTLSSQLIRQAVAATRWRFPQIPAEGMITFVDRGKVRSKKDPGFCFKKAGFQAAGKTKGGLYALHLPPDQFPDPEAPRLTQRSLLTA